MWRPDGTLSCAQLVLGEVGSGAGNETNWLGNPILNETKISGHVLCMITPAMVQFRFRKAFVESQTYSRAVKQDATKSFFFMFSYQVVPCPRLVTHFDTWPSCG
jgi:hypothetical protein